MTPQDHKNAINAAMFLCRRERDTENSGAAIVAHDEAVDAAVKELGILAAIIEVHEAQFQWFKRELEVARETIERREAVIRALESDIESIGAGGVSAQRITGERA